MYRPLRETDPSDDIWPFITAGVSSIDAYIDQVLVNDEEFIGFQIPFSHYQKKGSKNQSYNMDKGIIGCSKEEMKMDSSFPPWSVLVLGNNNVNAIRREFLMARKMGFKMIDIRFDALEPRHDPESKARMGVFITQIASFSKKYAMASLPPDRRGGRVNEKDLNEASRLEMLMTLASQGFKWIELEDDIQIEKLQLIADRARGSGTRVMLSSFLGSNEEWSPLNKELLQVCDGYKLTIDAKNGEDIRKMMRLSSTVRSSIGGRSLVLEASSDTPREIAWLSPALGSDMVLLQTITGSNIDITDPIKSKTGAPMEFWRKTGLIGPSMDSEWSLSQRNIGQGTNICLHIGSQGETELKVPIHNTILKRSNIDSIVLPATTTRNEMDRFFRNFRSMDLKGVLLDMPFMMGCIPSMDWTDTRSKKIGALNLVVCKKRHLYGYNTELYAIMDVLDQYIDRKKQKVLIIGCGTGGRAAALASRMKGHTTYLAGPTMERTEEVASELEENIKTMTYGSLNRSKLSYEVVINTLPATLSLGTGDNGLTVADMIRKQEPHLGIDLTKSNLWTAFLSAIESRGGEAVPGNEVLVHTIMRDQKLLLNNDVPEDLVVDILKNL